MWYTVQNPVLPGQQIKIERKRCHKVDHVLLNSETVCTLILFSMLELELGLSLYNGDVDPQNYLVQMMHSDSPESVKSHVLEQFADNILIAAIAYRMGVNCKWVQWVMHFGLSKCIDAYLQESILLTKPNIQAQIQIGVHRRYRNVPTYSITADLK